MFPLLGLLVFFVTRGAAVIGGPGVFFNGHLEFVLEEAIDVDLSLLLPALGICCLLAEFIQQVVI